MLFFGALAESVCYQRLQLRPASISRRIISAKWSGTHNQPLRVAGEDAPWQRCRSALQQQAAGGERLWLPVQTTAALIGCLA